MMWVLWFYKEARKQVVTQKYLLGFSEFTPLCLERSIGWIGQEDTRATGYGVPILGEIKPVDPILPG